MYKIIYFLLKSTKAGSRYYSLWLLHVLHYNTDGKYVPSLFEHGVKTLSITTLNYRCWSTSFPDLLHNLLF
jgi:hypothetical protein